MENIDFPSKQKKEEASFQMVVSPICTDKEGQKYAYVTFTGNGCSAEGVIPSCEIQKSEGFSEEEVAQLSEYLRSNLTTLKKMAAQNNVLNAFMKS